MQFTIHCHPNMMARITGPGVKADNTQHRGKYHCTAGIQFYWFGFNRFTAYRSNIFLVSNTPNQ